jgi:predicted Zn-dependent protease
LGAGGAGLGSLAFSPVLIEMLLAATGCSARGAKALGGFMVPEEVLKQAVSLLMERNASFADVFVERAIVDLVESDDRKINTSTLIEKGVGLRAVKDGKTFYAYTNSFDPEQIYGTARYVADAAAQGAGGPAGKIFNLAPQSSKLAFPITPRPSEVAVEKKIQMFRTLADRAWSADPRVVQVGQFLREIIRQVNVPHFQSPASRSEAPLSSLRMASTASEGSARTAN